MCQDSKQRNWPDCELKNYENHIKEEEYKLGRLYYEQVQLCNQINKTLKFKADCDFRITLLKKIKEDRDYCSFIEESYYGERPKHDLLTPIITDEVVLGYLSDRIDPIILTQIKELLKKEVKS